ncbi:MAG: murein L,D-transpeptidase catalytic domain family protein, partial [Sphingobacteriales bacterium]
LEQSSKQKRLWVIDIEKKDVLYNTYVSHGKRSGNEYAKQFSNRQDSNMSSPGFYVTKETYTGKHGLSLKLDGLDEGFNTNARERCIVMHGAEYASESTIEKLGFLGRSEGCPAIPVELHEAIISQVAGKTCIFVNAPVGNYKSAYLNQNKAVQEFMKDQKFS